MVEEPARFLAALKEARKGAMDPKLRVCEKIVYELSPNKGWCEIVFP